MDSHEEEQDRPKSRAYLVTQNQHLTAALALLRKEIESRKMWYKILEEELVESRESQIRYFLVGIIAGIAIMALFTNF